LAICYAAYAFFALPATPPADSSAGPVISFTSLRLLREPSAAALLLIALPIAAIHTAYYFNIGPFLSSVVGVPLRLVGPTLAIAQLSEVFFLFTLGPLLHRFGFKTILIAGVTAQALRFAIFALNPPAPLVILSLSLHGVAFACFFTTAVLYAEHLFPPQIRHSAQTVFGIALFGLGPALAGPYSQLFDRFTTNSNGSATPAFQSIWWTQAAIALACAFAIFLFFHPKKNTAGTEQEPAAAANIE
jgi:MFS family permease